MHKGLVGRSRGDLGGDCVDRSIGVDENIEFLREMGGMKEFFDVFEGP